MWKVSVEVGKFVLFWKFNKFFRNTYFVLYQTAHYKMIKFVKISYQIFYPREETLVVVKLQNCTRTMIIKSK